MRSFPLFHCFCNLIFYIVFFSFSNSSADPTPEIDEKLKEALAHGKKEFSENLMIVDLIRNDFGRCCEVGSIGVPFLMSMFLLFLFLKILIIIQVR
jgi:hypothetical protein